MPHTVLVIEDNESIRENLGEMLALAGYQVLLAEDGKKGFEMAVQAIPDLIVCDVMMPELDGYGLLHLLRRNADTRQIPFIFLTAKTERADLRKGMDLGADDFITKPFEDVELLTAIERRLQKSIGQELELPPGAGQLASYLRQSHDARAMDALKEFYEEWSLEKKQFLYQPGQQPRYLFLVCTGKVKLVKTHEDGKDLLLDLEGPGALLGLGAVLGQRPFDESALAMETTTVLRIPGHHLSQLLQQDASLAIHLLIRLQSKLAAKEERLMQMAYGSLRKRVAQGLLHMSHLQPPQNDRVVIEASRDEVAQFIGTATESLIRTLADFKTEKLLEVQGGRIVLLDPQGLRNLAY